MSTVQGRAKFGLLEQHLKSELHIQRFDIKLKGPTQMYLLAKFSFVF